MKNFRIIHLNFSDKIIQHCLNFIRENELEQFLKKNHQYSTLVHIPLDLLKEINQDFSILDFPKISYCRLYMRNSTSRQGIHIDGSTDKLVSAAVNIPLKGKGKHIYYKGNYETILIENHNLVYHHINWKENPEIDEILELTQSYLVRVDRPHQVIGDGSERWAITMRFEGNPKYEDLCSKLGYINHSSLNKL